MIFLNHLFLWLLITCVIICDVFGRLHPHVGLDEYQIMDLYGYPYEKHFITTEDGYILEVSRVLPRRPTKYTNSSVNFKINKNLMATTPGEPILLMHGLTSSGRAFVSHYADKALAFILVNHGYDVYMGNARGVSRSRRHVTLDPDVNAKEFWDFSWHEIGVYDQNAMLDYIINQTGFKKVSFVGHSQGGTTFLAMAAGRPETNDKIKIAFNFGGPGVMRYTPTPFARRLASFEADFQAMKDRLQIFELFRYSPIFLDIAKILTDRQWGLREFAKQLLNVIDIITTYNMDVEIMPVLASTSPSGSSMNQLLHYMQCVKYSDFRLYDYHDKKKNFEKYGSEFPPRYNLSQISAKAIMYYSKDDMFFQEKDVHLMTNQMQNAIPVEIKVDKFSHADYMWARQVNELVFKDVLWRLKNA